MKAGMRILAAAILSACVLASGSALAERPYTPIEQRLSPEQMRATGLDQLQPGQLSLLNQLLSSEQADIAAQGAQAERERRSEEARTPVSSSLKGEFRGWQSGAVLELENGQRWRVVDSDFVTKRLSNPKVTISPGLFGSWYMLVEGTSVKAKVKRVDL
ncbi:hypothetical protein [Lysobacter sp. Root494]|uniref:hypothetical protein n=1 Tax=Lysobacter sp. Root494 TaxID=1736549 RepID=UPI0006FDE91D|nr:hypothetical protein [Lysobacter sp. Root494]KQY49672.1 hypothetical protein ASD14_13150 [Lysobacter sp. Root494]